MTTEDLIEGLITEGMRAYKKLNRKSPEGRKLERREPVVLEGMEFSCWREYAVYKTAEYLRDLLPDIPIDVTLDMDSSVLQVEISDSEQERIDESIFALLEKYHLT